MAIITEIHVAYTFQYNPIKKIVKIYQKLNENKLDNGYLNFSKIKFKITSIDVDNKAANFFQQLLTSFTFNVRFNNLHTSISLKKKITLMVKKLCKKNKCKFKIDFHVNRGFPYKTE